MMLGLLFANRLLHGTRFVWIENRPPRWGLPSNSVKRHCRPAVAMHPQIVEPLEKPIRRYVANGPHRWAKWIGRGDTGGTDQAAGC